MEPETKKKIAEQLGYDVSLVLATDNSEAYAGVRKRGYVVESFDPETNDTQFIECLDYLITNDWNVGKDNYDYIVFTATIDDIIQYKGKTLKAAVIAALNEMFGE